MEWACGISLIILFGYSVHGVNQTSGLRSSCGIELLFGLSSYFPTVQPPIKPTPSDLSVFRA